MKEETKIEQVSEEEVGSLQSMAEIRFDCLVKMFDSKTKEIENFGGLGLPIHREVARKPQWFKCQQTLTLESIRHGSEYELGSMLKIMLRKLELHMEQYK